MAGKTLGLGIDMNIEEDGHLCLHVVDLSPDMTVHPPKIRDFSVAARIAAAYANRAGYPVTFVRPGFLIEPVELDGYYLPVRKVKQFPKAKPVPKSAIGKCVANFPAKKIFRKAYTYDPNDPYRMSRTKWVRAPGGSAIEKGDVWR